MALIEKQPKTDELEQQFELRAYKRPRKEKRLRKKLAKQALRSSEVQKPPLDNIRLRKFGAGVLLGLSVFVNTDKALGFAMWNGGETKAAVLSEYEGKTSDNLWIIVPGLGVQSGEGIASVDNSTLHYTGDVGYLAFEDNGVDPQEAGEQITQLLQKHDAKTVSFWAHSMGGVLLSEILKYVPREYRIKFVVYDSSPSWIYDAKNSFSPKASGPADFYGGGFLSKFGFEIVNSTMLHANHSLSIAEQVKDAWRVSITGSSPRLFTDELGKLGTIDIDDSAERIKQAMAVYYVMPENQHADETVFTREAANRYESELGIRLVRILVKNGGHADETDKPKEFADALFRYLVLPYQESNQLEGKRRN